MYWVRCLRTCGSSTTSWFLCFWKHLTATVGVESSAILRYLGHMCGLIPADAYQAAKVDEFIDGIQPHSNPVERNL